MDLRYIQIFQIFCKKIHLQIQWFVFENIYHLIFFLNVDDSSKREENLNQKVMFHYKNNNNHENENDQEDMISDTNSDVY